jgi:hypothetical protein
MAMREEAAHRRRGYLPRFLERLPRTEIEAVLNLAVGPHCQSKGEST